MNKDNMSSPANHADCGLWPQHIGITNAWSLHRSVIEAVIAVLREERTMFIDGIIDSLIVTYEILRCCATGRPIPNISID